MRAQSSPVQKPIRRVETSQQRDNVDGATSTVEAIRGSSQRAIAAAEPAKRHVTLIVPFFIAATFFTVPTWNLKKTVHRVRLSWISVVVLTAAMKLTNQSEVPVYTISGSNTARPLPEWLARRRKRSLKDDPEYANRVELLQDFEFEEASQCVRVSEDGEWVMSTGRWNIHCYREKSATDRLCR